jgi:hypothetical protein
VRASREMLEVGGSMDCHAVEDYSSTELWDISIQGQEGMLPGNTAGEDIPELQTSR